MLQIQGLPSRPTLLNQPKNRISRMSRQMVPNSTMKTYQVKSETIDDRISWLEAEINDGKRSERVRQIASGILTEKNSDGDWNIKERDWNAEIAGAYNYVRQNVRYTRDIHDVELFQKADRTLDLKIGDCDDIAILLGSILGNIGYPVIIRIIATDGQAFHHVYLRAGVPPHDPTEYISLDASQDERPGWEVGGITDKQDYLVSTF